MTKLGEMYDIGQKPTIDKNARQVPWGEMRANPCDHLRFRSWDYVEYLEVWKESVYAEAHLEASLH